MLAKYGKAAFPDLKGVLRRNGQFLVPDNRAVEIYLRQGYKKEVSFDEFKNFVLSTGINK
jgi:hypothetical protein